MIIDDKVIRGANMTVLFFWPDMTDVACAVIFYLLHMTSIITMVSCVNKTSAT